MKTLSLAFGFFALAVAPTLAAAQPNLEVYGSVQGLAPGAQYATVQRVGEHFVGHLFTLNSDSRTCIAGQVIDRGLEAPPTLQVQRVAYQEMDKAGTRWVQESFEQTLQLPVIQAKGIAPFQQQFDAQAFQAECAQMLQ
jgi:hypothetical protein